MSTQPTIAMYEASAAYLREALKNRGLPMPRTAVILGSGLGLSGIFITLLVDEILRSIANLLRFLSVGPRV